MKNYITENKVYALPINRMCDKTTTKNGESVGGEGEATKGGGLGPFPPCITIDVLLHSCQKHEWVVTTSSEHSQASFSCPHRKVIFANHISMINSFEGHTRSWKTLRQHAFHTYQRMKHAINVQISWKRGDVVIKPPLKSGLDNFASCTFITPTTFVKRGRSAIGR